MPSPHYVRMLRKEIVRLQNQRDELAEFLLEAHRPEIEARHHGDDGRRCSYCKAIRKTGLSTTPNS